MGKELRRHPRTQTRKGYAVACTRAGTASGKSRGESLAVRLLDVSASGACLVTTSRLYDGDRIVIAIGVANEKTPHEAKGVVRWSTTIESKGRMAHVAGVQFDRLIPQFAPRMPGSPPTPLPEQAREPRRKHKRFAPPQVQVECLPHGLLYSLGLATNGGNILKDLSLGGAQIVSTKRLKPGNHVDLILQFPGSADRVAAEGVVRWCRRDTLSLKPRWTVGVVFRALDESSENVLKTVQQVYMR